MPDRSFFVFGYQLPVCARCTGIIVGEILSIPFSFVLDVSPFVLFFFMVPMVIDGVFQLKTSYISTNVKRFFSGLIFGYGFLSLLILFVKWVL